MSINRRLLIAFLFILLIPLLVSHIVAYRISSGMLTERALRQLESVTSIQKKRIEAVVAQNLERLALVQSRTQLRQSLAAFIATHDKEHREKMIAILRDACLSIQNFQEISVFTMDGAMVASTSSLLAEKNFGTEEWFIKGKDGNHADDLFLDEKGQLKIYLTGPMFLQEKKIGVLVITSTIEPLISISQDYLGLGKTGETLIAKKNSESQVVVINPLRFDPKASLQRTFSQDGPVVQVMQGESVSLINSIDYRGKTVFASGEYIDDLDWGVVVKIDKDEALEPIATLQRYLLLILLICAAAVVLVSWWLSLTITNPISNLISSVKKMGNGDLSPSFIDTKSYDEIGQLASSFDEMRGKLKESIDNLNHETKRRLASEAMYHELFENTSSGVVIFHYSDNIEDFIIVDINKSAERIFGREKEYFFGKSIHAMYPQVNDDEFTKKIIEVKNSGVSQFVPAKGYDDGKTGRLLEHFLFTLHSGEIVCVIEDITEKTFIENENKKLEAINRLLQKKESLNRMAGAIAHHFNNKLGAIIGNLELAIYDMSNEGVPPSKHVLGAMSAASKASEVSSSMLTYLGQKPGKRIPINLSESCLQCLSVLKAATPDAILFKVDLLSPGPVINADTTQVQQILTNLVTNSLEALEGCFGSIHVTVQKMSPADIPSVNRFPITWKPQHENYACMEVRDSGSGIAAEDFEKIFDPFFTSKFTGRGLGLPVILGITQAHQGVITVESKKNQGSVFMVFFPIYQED